MLGIIGVDLEATRVAVVALRSEREPDAESQSAADHAYIRLSEPVKTAIAKARLRAKHADRNEVEIADLSWALQSDEEPTGG